MATTPFTFWKNVDKTLGNRTLVSLAEEAGMNYCTLKGQRSANRYPSLEDGFKLATCLGTSIEYLLTGSNDANICLEAKAVQLDPNLQALIRAVQKDPHLVHIIGSVIVSTEKQIMDA